MKSFRIPPWCNTTISSIESAPETIPPTSDVTFDPALAPLSVGTLNHFCVRVRRSALSASFMIGTSPAVDTRFGSSNDADTTRAI